MNITNKLHPILKDTTPVPVDNPRPFLERLVDTIQSPDMFEDREFWKAMDEQVLTQGRLLVTRNTEDGTSVRIIPN